MKPFLTERIVSIWLHLFPPPWLQLVPAHKGLVVMVFCAHAITCSGSGVIETNLIREKVSCAVDKMAVRA